MDKELWITKKAAKVRTIDKYILLVLFIAGVLSLILFADWWFHREHIVDLWFFIVFTLIFWYGVTRLILIWINYLNVKIPDYQVPDEGLKVAIFTTCTFGEPLSMFEKTLAACHNVTYPHTTYLLTDCPSPEIQAMAERHQAVLLEMPGVTGAKAGKINTALQQTQEDYILILDPDHIPFPDFLHQTLGYFKNEEVGFVQVAQAYYNQYRSFTAKGAAEQTYTFYGPTQIGLFGIGSPVAIGANCTFRRKALESIGGHAVGLAEDLLTSIRLHAAGWKSVYNPVVVSRGLVPEDFGSFCKQQLKWSRGVFEVTFDEIPKLFRNLSAWQKLTYMSIGTYYLVGVTAFFFTLIPYLYFFTGAMPASMLFSDFLINGSFLVIISFFIYAYVQRWMCDPETERGFQWRGMILKYACWPVFSLGFLLALVNVEIPYIPTSKKAVTGYVSPFVRPLYFHIILFIITLTYVFIQRKYFLPEAELVMSAERTWGMMAFAAVAALMSVIALLTARSESKMTGEDPWDSVDINKINN